MVIKVTMIHTITHSMLNFARLHLRGCLSEKKANMSLNEFSYTNSRLASCFDPIVANFIV